MRTRWAITVRGREHRWVFNIKARPEYVEAWREDGLDISEVVNSGPMWVVWLGLLRPWCWLQDRLP